MNSQRHTFHLIPAELAPFFKQKRSVKSFYSTEQAKNKQSGCKEASNDGLCPVTKMCVSRIKIKNLEPNIPLSYLLPNKLFKPHFLSGSQKCYVSHRFML